MRSYFCEELFPADDCVARRAVKITIDKRGANNAAVRSMILDSRLKITLHQSKYLNNHVQQAHRVIKHRTLSMLRFKQFQYAVKPIAGIETIR